ncbi:hypothetical protein J4413_03255 [Candidatus Woesearchaeota archaeon]|nr:hypothetical protein [Candidatus Woesearchaeota archaeon]
MSRDNARNSIGEAVDQLLLGTPDLQRIKDRLAMGFLEGISSGNLDWGYILNPASGVNLADLFTNTDAKELYDRLVDPLLRRDLHERRSAYSGAYGKMIETLVKV